MLDMCCLVLAGSRKRLSWRLNLFPRQPQAQPDQVLHSKKVATWTCPHCAWAFKDGDRILTLRRWLEFCPGLLWAQQVADACRLRYGPRWLNGPSLRSRGLTAVVSCTRCETDSSSTS